MTSAAAMVEVPCNLCGSRKNSRQYRLRLGSIVRCSDCGFSFVSPRQSDAHLIEKLQHWAEQDLVDVERLRIAFDATTLQLYDGYLARLARLLPGTSRRLLDIGCSTGAMLYVARAAGFQVEGLELGHASSRYGREQLGLVVHEQRLEEFVGSEGRFDVVVLLEVLEHLQDPSAALARISQLLTPGGLLLLSTPNFDSLFRRVHGARWWVVNCEDEHIMLFTPRTLRLALSKAGFSIEWLRVRGLDAAGILNDAGQRIRAATAGAQAERASVGSDYHQSRRRKERLKQQLAATGMIEFARAGLGLLDSAFSSRMSPLFGLGEQLVVIARKAVETG